jgi:hypothetical protein
LRFEDDISSIVSFNQQANQQKNPYKFKMMKLMVKFQWNLKSYNIIPCSHLQIFVICAVVAMCQGAVLPLGYVAPYASSYDAHTVNHAHAFAAAPVLSAPYVAAPALASPYLAAPALSAYSALPAHYPYLF